MMSEVESPIPKVSVVMPVKNGVQFIKDSIDSILTQSFIEFELIVVDDNSEDGTGKILADYQSSDSRVRVIECSGNGIVDALNFGIDSVKAPLIARMDGDDIAHKDRLKLQFEEFEKNEKLILLGTYYYVFEDEIHSPQNVSICPPVESDLLKLSVQSSATFGHPTIMVKTEAVREIGGYRKFFEYAEDHDLYLRLRDLGEFATIPKHLLYYRSHSEQISQSKFRRQSLVSVVAIFCDSYFRDNGIDLSSSGQSYEELAVKFLNHSVDNDELMSKEIVSLCIRAVQGLAMLPELRVKIQEIRRKIIRNLISYKKYQRALKFWKLTRRAKWLEY